jgi:hypothetical protein
MGTSRGQGETYWNRVERVGTQWGQRVVTVSGHTWSRRGRCGDKLRTEWRQSGDIVAQSETTSHSGRTLWDNQGTEYGQSTDRERTERRSAWPQWPNTMGTIRGQRDDKLRTEWGHTGDSEWSQWPDTMGTSRGQSGDKLWTVWTQTWEWVTVARHYGHQQGTA